MPRFLYLVTAHTRPVQVARLIDALLSASPGGQVLLHYDPTGPACDFSRFQAEPRFHCYPVPRAIRWGDFSLVETFLEITAWASARLGFDWLIWISGQDYPLRPLEQFEATLANSGVDASFRHFKALGHPGWPEYEGLQRYYMRHFEMPRFAYFHRLPEPLRRSLGWLRRSINEHQRGFVMRPRRLGASARVGIRCLHTPFSAALPCVGGWTWMNMNARCVSRVHEFVGSQPDYVAHYRRTHCPDESFLHTILANTPGLRIANAPLRHVHWGDRRFPSHPLAITHGTALEAALASGMPFGRKFDIELDAGCLDILDGRIAAGASRAGASA